MITFGVFATMMALAQSVPAVPAQIDRDSLAAARAAAPDRDRALVPPAAVLDTPPPRARPQIVELSDWYERRLRIHRALSYSVVPLFAVQTAAGDQLWRYGIDAPAWARTGHRVGATALAGVFTVNTVTGAWNLWDTRGVEEGRFLRIAHAVSMLAADAGFTWAGGVLSKQAETDHSKRRLHRTVALSSMGITLASGAMMFFFNR